MTASTIGPECRVAPVDGLRIVLVARRTQQVAAVVQRLVWQSRVHVGMWDPGHGVVTFVALPWRDEVPGVPARRDDAVMAR